MKQVMARVALAGLLFAPWISVAGSAAPGEVSLPLKDYLALLTEAEAADEAKNAEKEESFSELVSQKTQITVEGELAHIVTVFEVEVAGAMKEPLPLPFAALADSATVEPEGASLHWGAGDKSNDNELCLAASRPGRFRVEVRGSQRLKAGARGLALTLPASPAAVASVDLELPSELAWSLDGAAIVADEVVDEVPGVESLRRLSLAPRRGQAHHLLVSRKGEGAEAERTLARGAIVTLVELSETGARRHDLIHYEVLRGELSGFAVQLPAGYDLERAGTDEGEALPFQEGATLVVPRETRLTSSGYLYLSSGLSSDLSSGEATGDLALEPVVPKVEVRSRYLVILASAAVTTTPLPASGWRQVDLEDLPPSFAATIHSARPSAAWRRVEGGDLEEGGVPRLAVEVLPAAPKRESLVAQRETFTLLTVDGTLVHREIFDVRQGGAALEVELPPGAVLWTASVDGLPVRPVERGGRLAVPLAFSGQNQARVEVVAVQERAIPKGRSDLAMDLPRLDVPVLEHRWNLLLPEGNRYRYSSGALRPAKAPPRASRLSFVSEPTAPSQKGRAGVRGQVTIEDGSPLPGAMVVVSSMEGSVVGSGETDTEGNFWIRELPPGKYQVRASLAGFTAVERPMRLVSGRTAVVNVELILAAIHETIVLTMESPVLGGRLYDRIDQKELDQHNTAVARGLYNQQLTVLQQGLVGGVKPLAVEIPETGKGIFLAGALPPRVVALELDVRAGR